MFRSIVTAKFHKKTSEISRNKSKLRLPGIFLNIPRNLSEHSPEHSIIFPGIFLNIPWNLLEHSPESLITFHGISWNISRNLLKHSSESLITFPGIFSSILRNAKIRTFPESSYRFAGIIVNIPRVPCIRRIPFPIHVFLVL